MYRSVPAAPESASNSVAKFREANPPTESVLAIIANSRNRPDKWFPGLAKSLSKDKPAAAIHHLTGERERTCYDWCAGAVDPPARAVIKLLHSEVGWHVLEFLMRGSTQAWWREVKRARECARAFDQASQQLEMSL